MGKSLRIFDLYNSIDSTTLLTLFMSNSCNTNYYRIRVRVSRLQFLIPNSSFLFI